MMSSAKDTCRVVKITSGVHWVAMVDIGEEERVIDFVVGVIVRNGLRFRTPLPQGVGLDLGLIGQ